MYFSLLGGILSDAEAFPLPAELKLNLTSHTPVVETSKEVIIGELVAQSIMEGIGDIHSPVCGTISEICPDFIRIQTSQGIEEAEPLVISTENQGNIRKSLRLLGIDSEKYVPSHYLVISGVNEEPQIYTREQALFSFPKDVKEGIEVLKKLVLPTETILILPDGAEYGNLDPLVWLDAKSVIKVNPVHPAGIVELIAKKATDKETIEDAVVVGVDELAWIGRAFKEKKPFTEKVWTLLGKNYLIKIGTKISDLLKVAKIEPQKGDKLIFGGPMRGTAQYTEEASISKHDNGLCLIKAGAFVSIGERPCINCGECTRNCPARLQIHLIGRFAEFSQFEHARKYSVQSCFECGICGYICPARRPLVQYVRLLKEEIKKIDEQAKKNQANTVATSPIKKGERD